MSEKKTPDKKRKRVVDSKAIQASGSVRKTPKPEVWPYAIPKEEWIPGKITSNAVKNALTHFKSKFNNAQKEILAQTFFSHYVESHEIILQPQLIHYFLLRMVEQPNPQELWFLIAGRYVRYALPEFTLVTGLRYVEVNDRRNLESLPPRIKDTYFGHLHTVTNEDIRNVFLGISDTPDNDIVRLGIHFQLGTLELDMNYLLQEK